MEIVENKGIVYEFGDYVLDPDERALFLNGEPIHLPAKEFETLLLLVRHNGHALSKEEMISAIWQDSFVEEVNLAKQISSLRKIFNAGGEAVIETIPKHGYRLKITDLRTHRPAPLEPVIVEKRTVRRVTLDAQPGADRDRLQIGGNVRRSVRTLVWLSPLLVIAVGVLGYFTWNYLNTVSGSATIDPYAPIRLTDDPNDDTGPSWTRDGRIKFARFYSDDRVEMWITNADGTGQSLVPMPDGKRIFSWSPDEKKVLFQKNGDGTKTYLSNADGSGEILMPFRVASWSADSKLLAYRQKMSNENSDIFLYDVDSGDVRNLTNSEAFDADPSFSPDGRQVVFASSQNGDPEIYSIAVDGSNLRRLTFDPSIDAHPTFSPDGTQILFGSHRDRENAELYLMNSDGSGSPVKLINWDKSNETVGAGSWSPDGTKIAFFSDRNGKDDVYVISAETIRPKLLLTNPDRNIHSFSISPDGRRIAYTEELPDKTGELKVRELEGGRTVFSRKTELPSVAPDWSPAGDWVAFNDRVDGNSEVCLVRSDGSEFGNLTDSPAMDHSPSWSPDGRRIIFVSSRGEPAHIPRLFVMSADGSDVQPLTPRKGWEGDPIWWPDGSRIVFVCDRADISGSSLDICQIGLDGNGESRLLIHNDRDSRPAVSPDGKRIAFVAASDGNNEIYLMNADGSGLLRITRDPANDGWPKWSGDGTKLLFASDRSGRFAIYEVVV